MRGQDIKILNLCIVLAAAERSRFHPYGLRTRIRPATASTRMAPSSEPTLVITFPGIPPHRFSALSFATISSDRGSAFVCPSELTVLRLPIEFHPLFDNFEPFSGHWHQLPKYRQSTRRIELSHKP